MKKELLLIIDAQNDFCSTTGSLYVKGADQDMQRLAEFIQKKSKELSHIILSQDLHHVIDISHPYFWRDINGNRPLPFTQISFQEVIEKKWIPSFEKERVKNYLYKLEEQGEFPHIIWPEHCLAGSEGAAIYPLIMKEVINWAHQGNYYSVLTKGLNPYTEHFGLIRANIPDPDDEQTMENKYLIKQLSEMDIIWIAGEAQSHCVANTIKQLLPYKEIISKLVILENCMSPVTGFENQAFAIFEEAKKNGASLLKI